MTSRVDALKTNEFLRRRKLRLQQVREQSKDIARKIRQRAKVENLRHQNSIDVKKEKEYLDCQEKLVKHLEYLYSKGLQNVGTGHKDALEVTDQECVKKIDVSKLRGKEAAEALRRKKQEKLDEQKKLLDRKLLARETANELSREKSATVTKSLTKLSSKQCEETQSKPIVPISEAVSQNQDNNNDNINVRKNDMGTQWESVELTNEWVPNVPILLLPKDDNVKETLTEKADIIKKNNLFALSDEMPSSLRGGFSGLMEESVPVKPSLTLVSEYLQNRNLKLRHTEPSSSKNTDDLQRIKQTILRNRATRTNGNKDKSSVSTEPNTSLSRKKSITVYNHNTRNVQDMPCNDERLVSRDNKTDEDAYAQALRETTIANSLEKEQLNKHQKDMRTKVAVNKSNVDKEYRDTLAFLNSVARDKSEKPIKTAYMDEHHQQLQNERHQRKLQEEFKKIEKECYKHNCKHSKRKLTISENKNTKSRSPVQRETRQDFEYSWMPVPESDGNLAVHAIPNTNTRSKSGNTVKFSQADSYHEYRSRHKHTPPTKDVSNDRQSKRVVETVILQENDSDDNESSATSETSSVVNLNLEKDKTKKDSRLKDAERIIIYKVLEKDKKSQKQIKDKSKRFSNTANIVTDEVNKKDVVEDEENKKQKYGNEEKSAGDIQRGVSFEKLQEGIFEAVSSNGDNIASMYFTEGSRDNIGKNHCQQMIDPGRSCYCNRNKVFTDGGNNVTRLQETSNCKCSCGKKRVNCDVAQPSVHTSTTSFTTATNEKPVSRIPDPGFVKLIEDGGQESNKFYVGASGFLKDDNYEVIIQLRKKETETVSNIDKTQSTPHVKPVNSLVMEQTKLDNASSNKSGKERSTSPIREGTNVGLTDTVNSFQQGDNQSLEKEHIEVDTSRKSNIEPQPKEMCEKAVHTSFHDDFSIPPNVPKTDSISRPGTSTYTQTSFNSFMPRPAFMHMSSSTSTAYMSPPELILPNFLKQNHVLNKEEFYESENTMNQLDSNFDVVECQHFNKFIDCRCGVCDRYPSKTPPNTARSHSKDSSTADCGAQKRKCHKCRSPSDSNICHKTRKKSSPIKTKSSKDLPEENIYVMTQQSAKKKVLNSRSNSKASNKINPIVKDYVNKLLELNSKGLKAIEIINQDCSAVTTPGSSIINLPCNRNKDKLTENKISLEQIKNFVKQQILKENIFYGTAFKTNKNSETRKIFQPTFTQNNNTKLLKKKSLHKVKSLNISKRVLKKKKLSDSNMSTRRLIKTAPSASSSTREEKKLTHTDKYRGLKNRYKSSTSPRKYTDSQYRNSTSSDIIESSNGKRCNSGCRNANEIINKKPVKKTKYIKSHEINSFNLPSNRDSRTPFSSESGTNTENFRHLHPPHPPVHISTQTNGIIDTEIHFMKIAEDKLQNMEKIADLTEKCTKRLSNLAKVLEEVRRNKSLVYSQISTSDSTPESDPKGDKNEQSTENSRHNVSDPNIVTSNGSVQKFTSVNIPVKLDSKYGYAKETAEFESFLKDIPKPDIITAPSNSNLLNKTNKSTKTVIDSEPTKGRGKPPPALSRVHLKCGQDVNIIPHELSTVIEVDSPMSMRLKSVPSRLDSKLEVLETSDYVSGENNKSSTTAKEVTNNTPVGSDLIKNNIHLHRQLSKLSLTESSDDSKMRMMDMKKFNDIMLKPFISLKEYAKQCNIGLDEGSNLEDLVKGDNLNDDLSSLHSDGSSLPDVIAELLKRNIISEPFKFDTGSNVNSTTVSSESTLPVLALSKARKDKKKSAVFMKNKENMAETSETLSISSNPDLENAFQKLGMGWASSTLKKTKERLALSSSSNTSSSSMAQFKMKSFSQEVPNLATDSTSSLLDVSNKRERKITSPGRYNIEEVTRNAVQQTSLTNSMTVKEFLANELANKITFNNKSTRKGEEEFISLYETKMPEELKHITGHEEEQLSISSANHNRARTSTPVQIFKSQKYQSSSTSNTSNGFFSNADDLSSVKVTSSIRNHSTSDKDDLTIPNYSLKTKKAQSDYSKSD